MARTQLTNFRALFLILCSLLILTEGIASYVWFGAGLEFASLITIPLYFLFRGNRWLAERKEAAIMASVALVVGILYAMANYLTEIVPRYGAILWTSDSYRYDTVARIIASGTGLWRQLNPMTYKYVAAAGMQLGYVLPDLGFYKFLGLVYTLVAKLGISSPLTGVELNMALLAGTVYFVHRILRTLSSSTKVPLLTLCFVFNPILLDAASVIRKDVFLLFALAMFLYGMVVSKKKCIAAGFLLTLIARAVMIPALGIILLIWAFVGAGTKRKSVQRALAPLKRRLKYIAILGFLIAILLWGVVLNVFAKYSLVDLHPASYLYSTVPTGFSTVFLSNPVGILLYAFLYPFPPMQLSGWALFLPFYRSLYATSFLFLIPFVLKGIKESFRKLDRSAFSLGAGWLLLLAMMFYLVSFAQSSGAYDIIEPRYKLPMILLDIILMGLALKSKEEGSWYDLIITTDGEQSSG